MKRFIFIAFFLAFIGLKIFAGGIIQNGNGEIITVERSVSTFEKISNSISATVRYHSSSEYRIIVTTDSNLEQYVETSVKNGILRIKQKFTRIIFSPHLKFTQLFIDVYAPFLTGVSISSSGSFEAIDNIVTGNFEANISSSGNIIGDIESNDVSVKISSSGIMRGNITSDNILINISSSGSFEGNIFSKTVEIRLSSSGGIRSHIETETFSSNTSGSGGINIAGNSKNSSFRLSSSGSVFANEFRSNVVDIRISGSGNVNIWAVDNMKAHTSSRGGVTYRGDPKIEFSSSGSGKIRNE